MKAISSLLGSVFALPFSVCHAASVIILDEGINTDKRWNAKNVTERYQLCSSLGTIYNRVQPGAPPVFSYLSLRSVKTGLKVFVVPRE